MTIFSLLAHNSYIMYNKKLAKEIGIDESILFGSLCSFQNLFNGEEEFYCEQQRLIDDTGLSEYRLQNALKHLKDIGLVNVIKKGLPAKNYYQLNLDTLLNILHVTSDPKIKVTREPKNDTTSDHKIDTTFNNNQNNNNQSNKKQNIIIVEHPILTYWNSKEIIKHQPSQKINDAIAKCLKTYSEEDIKLYIDRYVKIINDPLYYFDYKWTLIEFLTRKNGISEFTNEGSKWVNYLDNQQKTGYKPKPKQTSILDLNFDNNEEY